jgi:competence protein ComEA
VDSAPKDVAPTENVPNSHERRQQQAVVAVLGLVFVALLVRAYLPIWFTKPLPTTHHTSHTVDLNRASVAELEALPGVGPELASAIVAKRTEQPFANVQELRAIPGLGPKTFDVLKSHVVVTTTTDVEELKRTNHNLPEETQGKLNINTATVAELEALPRIGPVLAEAIVATRKQKEFVSVDDLRRVRGIGAKTLEALRPLVMVP